MNYELTCPECGAKFEVDENKYAEILRQVKNTEFTKELHEKLEALQVKMKSDNDVNIMKLNQELQNAKNEAGRLLAEAKASAESKYNEAILTKNNEIAELKIKLQTIAADTKLANQETISAKDNEILQLNSMLKMQESENDAEKAKAEMEFKRQLEETRASLTAKFNEELNQKEKELSIANEQVDFYKNMKIQMSTKMVGESLEQHCYEDYNMHLRNSLPPYVYFEKDNEVSETGSKGDFIYREECQNVPVLSIMFEMKNQMETTEVKHRNEDFFKELDKDRKEKGCEYAVLVSLLETDSEYYNQGIVDVSYKYPKMYVIRPQFLCPLITLLRNAALSSYNDRKELVEYKEKNVDVTNFEQKLEMFKEGFSKSCDLTKKRFEDAIAQIDRSIADLQKVKDALTNSEKHLTAADNKLEDLTVAKLTRGNPTMKKAFEEARAKAGFGNTETENVESVVID